MPFFEGVRDGEAPPVWGPNLIIQSASRRAAQRSPPPSFPSSNPPPHLPPNHSHAAATAAPPYNPVASAAVNALFHFPPFFDFAAKQVTLTLSL